MGAIDYVWLASIKSMIDRVNSMPLLLLGIDQGQEKLFLCSICF